MKQFSILTHTSVNDVPSKISYNVWYVNFVDYVEQQYISDVGVLYDHETWVEKMDYELSKWSAVTLRDDQDDPLNVIRFENDELATLFFLKFS
jgi:hypothetical protein